MTKTTTNVESTFHVGDAVLTADGDIGRIVSLFPAKSDDEEWVFENPQDGAGAVLDLGPDVGRFSYTEDYFSLHDGPVPENSTGFMAFIVTGKNPPAWAIECWL